MNGAWLEVLHPGSVAQMTSHGSMTTQAFLNWLAHFSYYKVAGPCLLVFDQGTSLTDCSVVETADRHDITLLCLPSWTTLELQPMFKSVLGPFEH
jgi:hypothetical protein